MSITRNDETLLPYWAKAELRRLRGRITDLESALPFEGRTLRTFPTHRDSCTGSDYCGCPSPSVVSEQDAELVCSDMGHAPRMHKPVIDLDLPCRLVESGTPGHFHLYIDREVEQTTYFRMLDVLADAGIVERGYAEVSRRKGYSAVRHPDKPKRTIPW